MNQRTPPKFRFQAPALTATYIPNDPPCSAGQALNIVQFVESAIGKLKALLPSRDGNDRSVLNEEIALLDRYQKQLLDYADELSGTPEWIIRMCKFASDYFLKSQQPRDIN
jgi:hypothetical protein